MVPPAPTARVNDYAALLTAAERARLETRLAEGERATGAQVVIAIFPALDGESLEDFSIRLAQRWRIGRKDLDNGVILLVFVRDRKLRLEVGYGLEAAIPDAVAGQIIRDVVAPRFREGRWAAGLEAAAGALYARITAPAAPAPVARRPEPGWTPLAALGLVVGVIVVMMFAAWQSSRRVRRGRHVYTAGPEGWYVPPPVVWGSRRWGGGGGGGFSGGGGGGFGGGGASGSW